jgi:hypothetical protein
MSSIEGDLQVFFEGLQHDTTVAAAGPGSHSGYDCLDEEDWQDFFENLPDDTSVAPDPNIFFTYDWKDERDLQEYFEKLPGDTSDSRVIARSGRKSAKN